MRRFDPVPAMPHHAFSGGVGEGVGREAGTAIRGVGRCGGAAAGHSARSSWFWTGRPSAGSRRASRYPKKDLPIDRARISDSGVSMVGPSTTGGIYSYNDWRSATLWGDPHPDYRREQVRQYIRDNALM